MADLTVIRGDDFRAIVTLQNTNQDPFDLTGYTVKAQVRPTTDLEAPLTAEFEATIVDPPTDGIIHLHLDHTDTATMTGDGVWDVQVTDADDNVTTIVRGAVTLIPDVTRVV